MQYDGDIIPHCHSLPSGNAIKKAQPKPANSWRIPAQLPRASLHVFQRKVVLEEEWKGQHTAECYELELQSNALCSSAGITSCFTDRLAAAPFVSRVGNARVCSSAPRSSLHRSSEREAGRVITLLPVMQTSCSWQQTSSDGDREQHSLAKV